jgi:hypothetical protein
MATVVKILKVIDRYLFPAGMWSIGIYTLVSIFMSCIISPSPNYKEGKTFCVYIAVYRHSRISGYTTPWIGQTYDFISDITGSLIVLTMIWTVIYSIVVPRDE